MADPGSRVSACLPTLGTLLSLLDRAASRRRGGRECGGAGASLAACVCSRARAALRLLLFGLYAESLLMTQTIGEIANLLLLFTVDQAAMAHWEIAAPRRRQESFGGDVVRLRLEAANLPAFTPEAPDEGRRQPASQTVRSAEPTADDAPGVPALGDRRQAAGVLVALTELAAALAWASIPLPRLLGCDERATAEIDGAAAALTSSVGPADVVTARELRAAMWRQAVEHGPCVGADLSAAWRGTPAPAAPSPSSSSARQKLRARRRRRATAG